MLSRTSTLLRSHARPILQQVGACQFSAASRAEEQEPIRQAVRDLCSEFPGTYWRELDAKSEYPTDFINALQNAGG
jgi:hypothetical protein